LRCKQQQVRSHNSLARISFAGVGRGGMFAELCPTAHAIELERIHRFVNPWEAAASLQLRRRR
jgi:hypothetical protein